MKSTPEVEVTGRRDFDFAPDRLPFLIEPPAQFAPGGSIHVVFVHDPNRQNVLSGEAFSSQIGERDLGGLLQELVSRSRHDVDRHPTSSRAYVTLGLALLQSHDPNAAVVEFQRALEFEPFNYTAMANLAHAEVLRGNVDAGWRLYSRLLEMRPEDAATLANLARLSALRSNYQEAIRLLKHAVSLDAGNASYRFDLGMMLLLADKKNEAISELKVAARTDVRSAAMHHGLGVGYLVNGNTEKAMRAFKVALKLSPDSEDVIHSVAAVYLIDGHLPEAMSLLKSHLYRVPKDVTARDMLSWTYFVQKCYREAGEQLHAALEWIDDSREDTAAEKGRLLNNLALCYWGQRKRPDAARKFAEAIAIDPGSKPIAYQNYGRLLFETGRLDDARGVLEECKDRFPDDATTVLLLATVLSEMREYDRAISILVGSIRLGNVSPDIYGCLGGLLVDERPDLGAALQVLVEGNERYPNDPGIVNNLAYAYLIHGDTARARAVLERLPESDGKRVVITATKGLLCIREGNLDEGARLYREASRIASDSDDGRLAAIVRQKMHLELARAYLQRGGIDDVAREVEVGLSEYGKGSYHRDLIALKEMLRGQSRPRG